MAVPAVAAMVDWGPGSAVGGGASPGVVQAEMMVEEMAVADQMARVVETYETAAAAWRAEGLKARAVELMKTSAHCRHETGSRPCQ